MAKQVCIKVLLVEDNPGDVVLFRTLIESWKSSPALQVEEDGEAAINSLREMPAPWRPDLIVTDWNMPRMDGGTLLRKVTQDPRLSHIPVVVFTSSTRERDLAMRCGAKAFFVKPIALDEYSDCIAKMEDMVIAHAQEPKAA